MPGKFYDELETGSTFKHAMGRTVTEMDNVMFTALTLNTQPLHLNEDFAARTEFGQRIVNGIFTLGLVVGMSVPDLTEGTIVANLSYERVVYPNPVFHGDTLYVESVVLDKRESRSRPDCGIVRLRHTGRKQSGEVVVEVERMVLFRKAPTEKSLTHRRNETEANKVPRATSALRKSAEARTRSPKQANAKNSKNSVL